jgi:hypothetical protein
MSKMQNLCVEANIPLPKFSCKGNDFSEKDLLKKHSDNKLSKYLF